MSSFSKKFQHQFGFDGVLVAKRMAAAGTDGVIEFAGGLLGSYFGIMVAALIVSMKDGPAEAVQHSMWSGMGFGFVFWTLSISFINRVLIQGLSRSSLGKKLFDLEIISSGKPLDWHTIMTRWVMSYVSFAVGGLGFAYLFFNKEARALHDVVAHTDVVPAYGDKTMSVEYRETIEPQIPLSLHGFSHLMIMANTQAERPTATVIQMPMRAMQAARVVNSDTGTSVAELIELYPQTDEKKKAA